MATKSQEPVSVDSFDMTIEEFCSLRSASDRRVEMLAAFCASERAAGRTKDLESNYSTRFAEFQNQPV